MIDIKVYTKGDTVFTMNGNLVQQYTVEDVQIRVNNKSTTITYNLENKKSELKTSRKHEDIYSSLEDLKDYIDKQFTELIPKKVEQKEEVTS